jgi:hypothetical protein
MGKTPRLVQGLNSSMQMVPLHVKDLDYLSDKE